jgi:hypothetical protein
MLKGQQSRRMIAFWLAGSLLDFSRLLQWLSVKLQSHPLKQGKERVAVMVSRAL